MLFKIIRYVSVPLLFVSSLVGRDIILEFKGAYFLSTHSPFKDIYGRGGALYGPELTVQVCDDSNWYVFASIDYLRKKGRSIGLCNPTTVKMVPFALGVKYFYPVYDERVDLYVGLGIEPINVRTKNCSNSVILRESVWGIGGIAKAGAYYRLPHNLVLDFFIDYSFATVGSDDCTCTTGVQSAKANVSGAIFGVGLGYNF